MPSWPADPVAAVAAVDPDDARRAAEDILARPEYREPEPTLADRALEAIGDLLGRAVGALTGSGAGSVIGTVVVVAVLGLAVWLLARAVGAGAVGRRVRVDTKPLQGTAAPDDPAAWAAEAERLASLGDHRGALRCRYQELVAHLVRDRVVPDDPARTPAELRRRLSAERPELGAALRDVTERFEEAWYGGAEVDAGAGTSFAAATAGLRDALRRPAPVGAGS